MNRMRKAFKAALPHTVPVFAGYLVLGMAYGFLMHERGCWLLVTFLSSLLIFAGSLQYVQLDLITKVFEPISSFVLSLVINARHIVYGITMVEPYKKAGWKKWLLAFWMTDETFSLHCGVQTPEDIDDTDFKMAIAILDHLYWIGATCFGNVLGSMLQFDTTGMDFVLTALFVTIFVDQWLNSKDHRPALVGLFVPVVCLVAVPDQYILVSLVLIVVLVLAGRNRMGGSHE